jgi:CubicO group peptidase (beta-lactamase class C family)
MLLNNGLFNGRQVLNPASVDEILKDQTGTAPLTFTPYESDPLRKGFRYGLGCWIEGGTNGAPAEFSCQGAFGFSPWVDRERGIAGVLFVQRTLAAVNRTPSPGQSPYTVIRQKVREIANAR